MTRVGIRLKVPASESRGKKAVEKGGISPSKAKASIFGEFGCVHVSVIRKLEGMSYRDARKYLRELWFSKSEQSAILKFSHQEGDGEKG